MQSNHSIEHATTCEVKNSEGIFFNWVVFDINSMVSFALKFTDSHIGHRMSAISKFRMGEVVS